MYIVTGGAGFIGSHLVQALNQRGHEDILVVDDLSDGHKFTNLVTGQILDYLDKDDFLHLIQARQLAQRYPRIKAIFHEGACSATTEWDGRYMMRNNFEYSKELLAFSIANEIPFIYASSAAVYGKTTIFKELPEYEKPLNVYGYSKLLFDQHVRRLLPTAPMPIVGLRYFNVYGPHEQHKGGMASVAYHLTEQLKQCNVVKLFEGTDGYENGEQRRDFIYVEDVVAGNLWFLDNPQVSGIFNLGTGRCQSFNDVANAVIHQHQRGEIQYVPMPETLKAAYQSFTEADITALRAAGCDLTFHTVESGIEHYLTYLQVNAAA